MGHGQPRQPVAPPSSKPPKNMSHFDAADEEEVTGKPQLFLMIKGVKKPNPWEHPVAQFIASPIGGGLEGWHGKRPLGKGGFGLAGLWQKLDENSQVIQVLQRP